MYYDVASFREVWTGALKYLAYFTRHTPFFKKINALSRYLTSTSSILPKIYF
jgi:hypothetical protein